MTMKSPFEIFPSSKPLSMASSLSNTFAFPVNRTPSFPVILATAPSGQTLPRRILMLPVLWMHLSRGRIRSCVSKSMSGAWARFSASVWPVTVRQSPCNQPNFSKYFMIKGVPPILCTSSMRYFPLGFRSAIKAVFAPMRWKSSMSRLMPAVAAIARRWSTAFVEPPRALTTTMAFSKDSFLRISSGFRFRSKRARMALATRLHSSLFSGETAGAEEL
mmetsp:Transcript_102761/g.219764  ORF Transcript_102761/g.219764 Transcript_102761/m.219764 type:complete len:218 (+) Transcript_102761:469-1122(+)